MRSGSEVSQSDTGFQLLCEPISPDPRPTSLHSSAPYYICKQLLCLECSAGEEELELTVFSAELQTWGSVSSANEELNPSVHVQTLGTGGEL